MENYVTKNYIYNNANFYDAKEQKEDQSFFVKGDSNAKYIEHIYWNGSETYKKYQPKSWTNSTSLFFDNEDSKGFKLWPISGIYSSFSNEIVLFATRYKMDPTADLGFQIVGTTAIIVNNPQEKPTKWKYRQVEIPGTSTELNFFTAVSTGINTNLSYGKIETSHPFLTTQEVIQSENDIVYIVGTYKNNNIIARIKYESLQKFKFLDGLQIMVSCEE